MSSTTDETVNTILDRLFTNGAKETAHRLLLVQEDHSGAAQVTNARYLGGYSRLPVRDILLDALRAHEQEVRAEERERAAQVVCGLCARVEDYHSAELDAAGLYYHKRRGHEDNWKEYCEASYIRRDKGEE